MLHEVNSVQKIDVNGYEVVVNPPNLTSVIPMFGGSGIGRGIVTDNTLYVFSHQLYHAEVVKKMQFQDWTSKVMFYFRKRTGELFVLPSTEERKPLPADFFYKYKKGQAVRDIIMMKSYDDLSKLMEEDRAEDRGWVRESKQVGILYHFTTPYHLYYIIKEGKLKDTTNQHSLGAGNISMTRNPSYTVRDQAAVRLAFDGDKLSTRYKIRPFSDLGFERNGAAGESEEVVVAKEIDIKPYLLSIDIDDMWKLSAGSIEDEYDTRGVSTSFSKAIHFAKRKGYKVNFVKSFTPHKQITESNTAFERPERGSEHVSGEHEYFYGKRGAGLVAVHAGSILLCLRSQSVNEPGTWSYPGGRMEENEDPRNAAVREFREETKYKGKFLHLQPLAKYQEEGFQYDTFIAYVPEKFEAKLDWENVKAGWFKMNELPAKLHPGMQKALPAIRAFINKEELTEANSDLIRLPDDEEAWPEFVDNMLGPLKETDKSNHIEPVVTSQKESIHGRSGRHKEVKFIEFAFVATGAADRKDRFYTAFAGPKLGYVRLIKKNNGFYISLSETLKAFDTSLLRVYGEVKDTPSIN